MVGRAKLVAVLAAFVGLALVQTGSAWAESCTFANGKVTATITAGSEATLRVSGSEIWFGQVPSPCGGATTANAGSIEVFGSAGTVERLIIDESTGTFTPGSAPEADLVSEIEMVVQLFDATDRVFVKGTATDDVVKLGESGLRLFADNDVDVTFGTRPQVEFDGVAGNDEINARGGGGAGAAFLGPVTMAGGEGNDILRGGDFDDVLRGGPGDDTVDGQGGWDKLFGDDGVDKVDGGPGDDQLEGGPGLDSFYGRDGNDVINAFRPNGISDRDTTINGGLDTDTAYLDGTDDRRSTPGVELVIVGAPDPPPPPTGPCVYNASTRVLAITMTAGTPAALRAVGDQFFFGSGGGTACPSALLSNTDEVNIFGQPSSSDTLSIEVPGLWLEDFTVDLRSSSTTTDRLRIVGGAEDNIITLGSRGIDLFGTGGTADVLMTVAPDVVELHGGGGVNTLNAQGGDADLPWAGGVHLYAGDQGDTLLGSSGNDEIYGGAGDDSIHGFLGGDLISGAGGNDDIRGDEGDDDLRGGSGHDALLGGHGIDVFDGGEGDDSLDARRPVESPAEDLDGTIDGGAGTDTAYVDAGEGSRAVNVETLVGDNPPPPPPPNADCQYEPVGGQINVSLDAGERATFKVVGSAIYLGDTACGAATTTTTSRIVVAGPAGSVERVEVDQRGGAFAPGHVDEAVNPESTDQTLRFPTLSEIEFFVNLGNDPGDTVAVRGTTGNDTMAAGFKGVVWNGDGDTDVFVGANQWYNIGVVELYGEGGVNTLNAGGAPGTGGGFNGKARFFAGDLGDTLSGNSGNDELIGGAGIDTIDGGEGADVIVGGGANDTLRGNGGADDITGGTGADTMIGGAGADIFRAVDGAADTSISCGADVDTAYYDGALESPVGCEIRNPT